MRETPKAAVAFAEYCDLGSGRSLAKLAQKWGKSRAYVGQLERWSSTYGWVDRAKQYDEQQRAETRQKKAAEVERMDEEHALIGRTQLLKMVKHVDDLVKQEKFGSVATVQLFKAAYELERISRGAATERQELTGLDGEPLQGIQAVFYLPKIAHEEGYEG